MSNETDNRLQPLDAIAAEAGHLGLRLGVSEVEIGGGVVVKLRPISAVVAEIITQRFKPAPDCSEDDTAKAEGLARAEATRFALVGFCNLFVDDVPVEVKHTTEELEGREYTKVTTESWRELRELLPPWLIERLQMLVMGINYLGPMQKKSASSTAGSPPSSSSATAENPTRTESAAATAAPPE